MGSFRWNSAWNAVIEIEDIAHNPSSQIWYDKYSLDSGESEPVELQKLLRLS